MIKRFINSLKNINNNVNLIGKIYSQTINDAKNPKVNLGQIQASMNNQRNSISEISDVEFQVFSQFGDDGIIQYLIDKIGITNRIFVEFGVENYKESNTRFLLINNKWSGLIIDGGQKNIDFIKRDYIYTSYDLHVECAFITRENINSLIAKFLKQGYPSEIGLLSVDIDGNDYWVWKEINVINPVIVIVEYNAIFGPEKPWTIPYKEDFYRLDLDPTYQYWGTSLKAICILAEEKGYFFIGCNAHGNNAYFLRKDKIGAFKPLTSKEGFKNALFSEFSEKDGTRVGGTNRIERIRGMKVFNVENNSLEVI